MGLGLQRLRTPISTRYDYEWERCAQTRCLDPSIYESSGLWCWLYRTLNLLGLLGILRVLRVLGVLLGALSVLPGWKKIRAIPDFLG